MKVYLASDHGGFKLKKELISFLKQKKYEAEDCGPFQLAPKDDYPDYAIPLARKVAKEQKSRGIVICRNGQGVCIATNKVKGIRAVTGFSPREAKTTRSDDNANVLCLPADYLSVKQARKIVLEWLQTPFSQALRHQRRLHKIEKAER